MASQSEINGKRLADEIAKPFPDEDIVYHLQKTSPYWNTVDTDKMRRGADKLQNTSLRVLLDRIAPKEQSKKEG